MYVTKMCKMTFEGQKHTAKIVIGPHPKEIYKHVNQDYLQMTSFWLLCKVNALPTKGGARKLE